MTDRVAQTVDSVSDQDSNKEVKTGKGDALEPGPTSPHSTATPESVSTNVTNALNYVGIIQTEFADQPHVYNAFLNALKDFKENQIDTPAMIKRIVELFNGYPDLMLGFNDFVPAPYRIEYKEDEKQIIVTTPTDSEDIIIPVGEVKPRSTEQAASLQPKALSVSDALGYLNTIKAQYTDNPQVYDAFLDLMKEFKEQRIDPTEVIKRVIRLFSAHPYLIRDFNTFLSDRYNIEYKQDENQIIVTTPSEKMVIPVNGLDAPHPTPAVPPSSIESAQLFVQRIKEQCDPETYKEFLNVLARYRNPVPEEALDQQQISRQLVRVFKDHPDISAELSEFLPALCRL